MALPDVLERIAAFDLRGVHPNVRFGTASDRYAGWIGQIYPPAIWDDRVASRAKRLGGDRFEERTVPVESTVDYFRHFSVLEIDFTFYRPLLDEDGGWSSNLFVLQRYAEHAPDDARFILKAPQAYAARQLRRGGKSGVRYEPNPDYLDAGAYRRRFLEPAAEMLGPRLAGVLFEQEYARRNESPEPEAFVAELDTFFGAVAASPAGGVPTHLEVRSPHLLAPPYPDWLASRGLGLCFSHWTWLPSIKEQWERVGGRFTAASGDAMLRLLTPRRMRYEDAYRLAHPFDQPVAALSGTPEAARMVDEAVALAVKAIDAGARLDVIVNNRAWGNAPALAQTVARRLMDFVPPDEAR